MEYFISDPSRRRGTYAARIPMRLLHYDELLKCRRIPRSDDESVKATFLADIGHRERCVVVFISHRWNGDVPDRDDIKYRQIVHGMTAIARACNVESNQVYIWIDYFGINQDEHELNIKEMGIESLPSYIESSDVLFTPLLDDGGPADQPNNSPLQNYYTIPPWWISLKCVADDPNEYFGRTWCRTEMYLGTNVNLPEPGFGYFKTLAIDRVGRPHFLSLSDNVLNTLPPLSMSWFERFDPLKGAVHDEDDKYIIKRIMKKAPHRTASDLVDTVPLIHGKKCGRGRRGQYTYKNGDRYDGDWVDDDRHGHGVDYLASGDRYDGDFVDGKRHGHGVFYHANGNRYDGDYVDGKRHGHGVFYYADGSHYEGEWSEGVVLK